MIKNIVFQNVTIIIFLMLAAQFSFGQTIQGDIVEYFGKEKVNEISEGQLIHVFQGGLTITIPTDRNAPIDFNPDIVIDKFLSDAAYTPRKDEVFGVDRKGNNIRWRSITVDTSNTFEDRALRSSYVFLTYKSPQDQVVIFEASGHSLAIINGFPHEGDHYDFGWSLIPIKLKKGTNTFVLQVGRFPRIRARLIAPTSPVLFTSRDLTLPDVLSENIEKYLCGIRLVNTSEDWIRNPSITAEYNGLTEETKLINLPPLSVTKIGFYTPHIGNIQANQVDINLALQDQNGRGLAEFTAPLAVKSRSDYHKRTFLSDIDHSVQYFGVTPSLDLESENQALFLSVHGAGVEATNQSRAYKRKDWGTLVAATNRRPYGFAWEDWGRLDGLEVLSEAKRIYQPDPQKVYLTGHSMGGHGTWYLGATYPDHFAAIAPCAGYPDLLAYRNSFVRRMANMNADQLKRFGMTPEMVEDLAQPPSLSSIEKMIARGGNPSRTLKIKRNYLHHGVYILHGEKDNVVPTFLARDMRQALGEFHNDFAYYEYPGGAHWYGDHSVDWPPIFDFFKRRTIPKDGDLNKLEFHTTSPGVSASSHFVTIHQQEIPLEPSSFHFTNEENFALTFENTVLAEIDLSEFEIKSDTLLINNQIMDIADHQHFFVKREKNIWKLVDAPSKAEKGSHRYGGFKDAFRNQVVLVYGTKGDPASNEWNRMKAMFDAETFGYRHNGRVEVARDIDFIASEYHDRNVILYGNKDNNAQWANMLKNSPVQVSNGEIKMDKAILTGDNWATYFVYPRPDSDNALIGVVAATGIPGMKGAALNHYLVNGTSFPDLLIFDASVLKVGLVGVKCAGFFGNDWSIETGDFEWR